MSDFLLLATIYLLTMIVAVPLSTRLGLGSVLGYLIAGIVIGPVLGVTGDGDVNDLQHFAEFGVVMMLFIIGLELEPRALWGMRRRLIGLGGLQIAGTMALIFGVTLALNQSWQVSLALGMILSLSSTAIVLQTLSEKNLMQTRGGRDTFAVLLTQDIAVIPMLALMPLLAMHPGGGADDHTVGGAFMAGLPGWAAALVTLSAIAFVVLAGSYAVRPLFRFVHAARLREMDTIVALFIVVGIASLMSFVGLSPALGTFLAGVMLASSEFKHELESQVEPFKGLLLGLFFITVGAGMDFALLAEMPVIVLCVTLVLIAIKAGVLHLIARVVKMPPRDRTLFTLSLAQAGEFGFVLISYAVALNVLPDRLAQGFLLVIALSMLMTPLLFIANDQISRRLVDPMGDHHRPDEIDDQQPIIIAGVGRFGQVVNRLVTFSGLKTTVLDHDLKLIQLMRRFGFKGYFGDPTRPEILAAAGLDKAQILVAALDNPDNNVKLVRYVREKRPDITIIARARDRINVYQLYAAGADHIVREIYDSSLRVGRYVLENAGFSEYEAHEAEAIFYKIDRASLRELAELWDPEKPTEANEAYIERTRRVNQELETALMERFSHGPAAGPIKLDDDEDPEHGLTD
ncbi:MAG TPA: monovalent cation:proton antiporter-2 (CPA2) family protein [Paracoccus sp. (in: a-proteobacteria)]|uniref:monovalent cation:proton antiporter-2 (CPA2) family protein n=1 Tax=uncultured Paracoccus sp. TaxID=189685 RepID=UPI00262AD49D|nr:monovalent cation:proton antiporter-2 (CPA2) family protein [uncultured Paracoccus sp.]HMQ41172.1 monovalent cation:proton antiporter-2 (CPA2) family protein [Paracoccus sp. (in: a-proteobacteria)]HMR34770.1 monovalent cation:proton antiporter-2 (CPA2) family protein [Paracoccus sp. (in: a-proteobacteria)]